MDRRETSELVEQEYKKRYPDWTGTTASDVVLDSFGGNIAVVRAIDAEGVPVEEICFAYPDKTVRIFTTTEELARFLEMRAKAPLIEKLFSRPLLSGITFVVLLIFVFIIGFFSPTYDAQSLAILGSVVGLAAGYFFGTSPRG